MPRSRDISRRRRSRRSSTTPFIRSTSTPSSRACSASPERGEDWMTDAAEEKIVTAAVLIIGNEILSGRTQDQNLAYLATGLNSVGVTLREARVVPDIPEMIIAAVNELRATYDYLFTTGGIGPTHDDITSECVAQAFG